MTERPAKDNLDFALDFFLGAVFGGFVAGFTYFRFGGTGFSGTTLAVVIIAWGIMGGAILAMYRGAFWAILEAVFFLDWFGIHQNSWTPPPQGPDRVMWQAYLLFWSIFLFALAALILYLGSTVHSGAR